MIIIFLFKHAILIISCPLTLSAKSENNVIYSYFIVLNIAESNIYLSESQNYLFFLCSLQIVKYIGHILPNYKLVYLFYFFLNVDIRL